MQLQKAWKQKEESIKKDQTGLYNQMRELVEQAIFACIVRDTMKEYRYGRADAFKEYNTVLTFSHVALENYALQQLWKLFDKKNSVLHVWYVVDHMPHPNLKIWFDKKIKAINADITYLSNWRHNAIGHRSAIGYFAPQEFERKLANGRDSEKNIKEFLISLLCQMQFEMHGTSPEEQKRIFIEVFESFKQLVESSRDKVLHKI